MTGPAPKRILVATAILALVVLAFGSGATDYLSLDSLKARRDSLAALVDARPLLAITLYFLIYVAVAALSIPGAAVMTLAGGAIFGLWLGVATVSFASVAGATLAFLGSRYLFRDWVKQRFGKRLEAVDGGLERDGTFYLLAIRLNPVFPFFLVNLAMGLTRIPALKFALVSQIGMLPATFVYVNAGTQLGRLDSLSDVASPQLIGSLVLLSLLPILGKLAADFLRRRRVYKGHKKPKRFDRNLIVIGAGAGGLVTAYIAALVRAKVTLIEEHKMGGDCLNTGCVPSKALIRSARLAHEMRHAERFGLAPVDPGVDFPTLLRRVKAIIAHIEPADSVARYSALGVDVRQGHAQIVDPWTVEVNGERLTSRAIVIAAGAEPVVPPIAGIDTSGFLTSDTMWDSFALRETLPKRLLIIGGGPIGVEMAQAFVRLGAEVILVEGGERILPKEDIDVAETIAAILREEGVDLRTGHEAVRIEGKLLFARDGGREAAIPFDDIILAVGRKPRLKGYGLESIGIDTDRALETNDWLETLFPNIYAVGDVAGSYQFTHAASHQAWHAAVNALFGGFRRFKVDYRVLPWVTFTDPEVAHVGHNEASARDAGIAHEVVRYELGHLDRAVTESANRGFVKLLVPPGKDRIIGATIVGHNAGELIAPIALAMKHDIGLRKLLGTVHAYPTMAEANKMAAGEWRKARQPERLLGLVERYLRWRRG
ncbi:MAG TPA: FAD-dependent oxidoreductase [Allosphingosinicella sp.]|nr:FAD-dependent oxidoreductase [Allosphingosinicella sp.]